ncbi:MAG TPA: FMN-binding glutamate synthase family protein [Nitrososphaerales archaeon]|nr:FMN-binding glutamate synthase family protein [Nitrososphaerales archaeon]
MEFDEGETSGAVVWNERLLEDIDVKATLGRYRIRGFSTFQRIVHFDDLIFLPPAMSEGQTGRIGIEDVSTKTVLKGRFAKNPMVLSTPVYITGMSYGALSKTAKASLAKGAAAVGTASCTGDGGMLSEERNYAKTMIYQLNASRYGVSPQDMVKGDAIEVVVGQGAKPATGGLLMGQKVSEVIAKKRDLPPGIDQRSPTRHPEWLGPDDLGIFIEMLREVTDWRVPIQLKIPACRVKDDVKLAAKAGADGIVIDGMQAGTGASSEIVLDHSGIPTLPGIVLAREALKELGLFGKVYLVASGGIRNGVDAAKAIALGADAVAIGEAAMIALNCNKELPGITDFRKEVGVPAGYCTKCHTGKCPVGITTQDPKLEKRLILEEAAQRVARFLDSMTLEMRMITSAFGRKSVHDLTPGDLAALNIDSSIMGRVPLVGTDKVFSSQNLTGSESE